uniref:Uncharacterized protein n=1 Tax=viral metagenome TaxID=1070528 RepID=A0A6C0I7P2_9ZZZZ
MSTPITLPSREDDGTLIDYLDEDPELPNQRYVIVSFMSPEKVVKRKEQYFFEKFIEWMDYDWKVEGLDHFAAYISKKYEVPIDSIMADMKEFKKTHHSEIRKTDVPEKYSVFLLKHEKELQEAFDKSVNFNCNIRGVKVRRAFPSYEESQLWCKVLQRKYPKDNIVIGKMGCWLPWDPSEHLMDNVEYANSQLNEIMRKYKENESNRELFFAEEREQSMKAQKEENAKRKAALAAASVMTAPAVHPAEGALRDA